MTEGIGFVQSVVLKEVLNLKKRYNNFKLWYVHLRAEGVRLYGYPRYSRWKCFQWAFSNSGTHNLDGSYFTLDKPKNNVIVKEKVEK